MNNWQITLLRIKTIIAKQFGTAAENIRDNELLLASVDGDSLDVVELLLTVEDEFSIEIPDEIAEELDTVEKVARYIIKVGASENVPTKTDKNDVLW